MKRLWLYCSIMVVFLVAGCVAPDQYRMLESRVAAIEIENSRKATLDQGKTSDFDRLEKQMGASSKMTRENYAEVKYEIQQIKEQFYRLQGQIEEIQHKFGTSDQMRQEDLDKRIDRLDTAISKNFEKVIALEKYMGFEPSGPAKENDQKETSPPVAKDTEEGLYDFAKKLFDEGDKENARIQFENFINKYPDSKKADNARFWIADSFYAEKWYEKAILEYQKVLETYPDSNKTAAARLKQGYAFAALGEKANARLILKELIKRHPDSKEAQYAREKLKGLN